MRKGSDRINGFWEEGYHYYLEFRGKKLTVRDYRRAVCLETEVSYDERAVERGERATLSLKDNVLSRDGYGRPFTIIRELTYENGELHLLYYYTIMGETLYTLKKVDHGPFDHIRVRDDEFLKGLQGKWVEWRPDGKTGTELYIRGNSLTLFSDRGQPFHVVSYAYEPDAVYLVPANLIDSDFGGYTRFRVLPDRLTSTMMVCDMSMPLSVFARPDQVHSIEIPPEARRAPRNTMLDFRAGTEEGPYVDDPPADRKQVCPECGAALSQPAPKFCPECGRKLEDA